MKKNILYMDAQEFYDFVENMKNYCSYADEYTPDYMDWAFMCDGAEDIITFESLSVIDEYSIRNVKEEKYVRFFKTIVAEFKFYYPEFDTLVIDWHDKPWFDYK